LKYSTFIKELQEDLKKERTEIPLKTLVRITDAYIKKAIEVSKDNEQGFRIPALGTLRIKRRKAQIGRNPGTGETLKIPARNVLTLKPSKEAKEQIK
jgi:DNA-binding protein HU-beta